jgi:hypothetical protein
MTSESVRPTSLAVRSDAPTPAATHAAEPSLTVSATPSPTPRAGLVVGEFNTTITDPDRFASDVTVIDRTGLVQSISGETADVPEDSLAEATAPRQGLVYRWVVLGCSRSIAITFEPADIFGTDQDTYRLSVVQENQAGSCPPFEFERSVSIALKERVPASRVRVISGVASFRHIWGADRFNGRYRTEFEMLDRTGLITGLADPTNPGPGGRISEAEPPDVGLVYWPGPAYCVYRITMLFERAGDDQFRLRVWFDARWKGSIDCPSSGVGRWVLIQLAESILADQVREVVEGP